MRHRLQSKHVRHVLHRLLLATGMIGSFACGGKGVDITVNDEIKPLTLTASSTAVATTKGRPISFTPATAGGGTRVYTYDISGLPAGLTANTTTGLVSGTPTATFRNGAISVTVTDDTTRKQESAKYMSLTVNDVPTATTNPAYADVQVTQGAAATPFIPVTATEGTAPIVYSISPTLPAGMSIDNATGRVSGTATSALNGALFTVTATDAVSVTTSSSFRMTVNTALGTTGTNTEQICTINIACNFTVLTRVGGTSPFKFTITPALPKGLSISEATGAISGIPTSSLTRAEYTIVVTDAAAATSSRTFQLTVASPLTATVLIANKSCTQGASCVFKPVSGAGGVEPLTYSVGALPLGLSISSTTGEISGTPTGTQSSVDLTVTVRDQNGSTATGSFKLQVNVVISVPNPPLSKVCTQGSPCRFQIPVPSGGTSPITYAITPALPPGLSLNSQSGLLSGTATTAIATTLFSIQFTDANGANAVRTFSLTVNPPVVTTLNASEYQCTVGAPCAFTAVSHTGGSGVKIYSLTGGTLPDGLQFNTNNGAISGTPVQALASTIFTVTVTDGADDSPQATSSKSFAFAINGPPVISVPVPTVVAVVNVPMTVISPNGVRPVVVAGGTGVITYQVAPVLPNGLVMNPQTGFITGTPTVVSSSNHTVTVSDGAGATASRSFTMVVNPALAASVSVSNKNCLLGANCTFAPVVASGGAPPLSFQVSPALPIGLTMNGASGEITGTPTQISPSMQYFVTVTDAAQGKIASMMFSMSVTAGLITTQVIAEVGCGQANSIEPTAANGCTTLLPFTPVVASGGTGAVTFSLTGGTLPVGLSFNTGTGRISGSAIQPLSSTAFTITATDAVSSTSSKQFRMSVLGSTGSGYGNGAPSCIQGVFCGPFNPVAPVGGKAPYTYSTSGLPPGITLNPNTGAISGTPQFLDPPLSFNLYSISITDALGRRATNQTPIIVTPAPIPVVTTVAIPEVGCSSDSGCTVGIPFTPVTASGGSGAITFALSGGTLPPGLTFNTANGSVNGSLSGGLTSTVLTVTATDAVGTKSAKTFTISSLFAERLIEVQRCVANIQCKYKPINAVGGKQPVVYNVDSFVGSINPSTGEITTQRGHLEQSFITVYVTDAFGRLATRSFNLAVDYPPPSLTVAFGDIACGNGNGCNAPYPLQPITASGGSLPYTFKISPSLPANWFLDSQTGQITTNGAPTGLVPTTYTMSVNYQYSVVATKTFVLSELSGSLPTPMICQLNAPCSFNPAPPAGGRAPVTTSITGGTLHNGLTLNGSTSFISGTPTQTGTRNLTFTYTDAAGRTATRTISVTVNN